MNWRRFLDNLLPRGMLEARDPQVRTIVSIVYTTAAKTFDGPAIYVTAGSPLLATRQSVFAQTTAQSNNEDGDDDGSAPTTTTAKSSARASSTSKPTSFVVDTSSLVRSSSTTSVSSTTAVTSTAVSSYFTTTTRPTTTATRASQTASATATETAKTGMSGGGIAGLIFGIILGLGLIIGAIMFFNKRQKQKMEQARRDDEKAMMARNQPPASNPSVGPFPTAPRISLRPGSQFSPNFGANDMASNSTTSFGSAAPAATATFPVVTERKPVPGQQPGSVWERPGASNAAAANNDPANPFGNHAETLNNSPPRNAPFEMPAHPEINAADFPLPASGTSTPRVAELGAPQVGAPSAPVGTAISEPGSAISAGEVAGAAAVGAVAGAAVVAAAGAARSESPSSQTSSQSPAKPEHKVHRVQMDFVPSMDDELPIRAGQLVKVQHEYDDGWALVSYMDSSRSGVVPRTCLSKNPLQPRPMNGRPGPNGPPGPGMRGPPQGRPMSPAGRPGQGPRSQSPYGPGPGPRQGGRPESPYGNPRSRPESPYGNPGPRSQSPYGPGPRAGSPANMGGRPRAGSSSSAGGYPPYAGQGRSMSPGPYGAGGLRPTPRPDGMGGRRRSNSMGQVDARRMMQQGGAPGPQQGGQRRKPVGGME